MPAIPSPRAAIVNLCVFAPYCPLPFPVREGVVQTLGMNLARSFWNRLKRNDPRVLLERLEPDGQTTWRQTRGALLEDTSRWMAALQAAGIGPGDRVALSLGKSAGLVTAHLAVLGVGAGVVPLNPALTPRETAAVLARAEVRLAITHPETVTRSPEITAAVQGPLSAGTTIWHCCCSPAAPPARPRAWVLPTTTCTPTCKRYWSRPGQ